MGKNNSSKYVVRPVFNEISKPDCLAAFLKMVFSKDIDARTIHKIKFDGHDKEEVISANAAFLEWCRAHTSLLKNPELANQRKDAKADYRFEGATHPDVYIEADNFYLVIEAKWTERKLTTSTTWSNHRDQLLRHMDALLTPENISRGKQIFGMYIIDANKYIKKHDVELNLNCEEYYKKSLPHRQVDASYEMIKAGFLGVYTWQQIIKDLKLPVALLPDGRENHRQGA